jgi:hypothetical protein
MNDATAVASKTARPGLYRRTGHQSRKPLLMDLVVCCQTYRTRTSERRQPVPSARPTPCA